MNTYYLPEHFFTSEIKVLLLGCGGSGCTMVKALSDIHHSLRALEHPSGLKVTIMDGDSVSVTNLLRQSFYPDDLGKNKAQVLVNRYNLFLATHFTAVPRHFDVEMDEVSDFDIIISCVDSGKLRYDLCYHYAQSETEQLFLDFGNGKASGQWVLGHLASDPYGVDLKLPNVYDLFGEALLDGDRDDTPTCSAQAALNAQNLMTNRTLVNLGSALLWELLQTGQLTRHGGFMDLETGIVTPLPIAREHWQIFNYEPLNRASESESESC